MAIKRIQLRGISRTPSDRMTEDGGLAESLNMQLQEQESAPITSPKRITTEIGLPSDFGGILVLVHKMKNQKVYVVEEDGVVGHYVDGELVPIFTLAEGETISSAAPVGNTIAISTNMNTHYALHKGAEYVYLGTEIPFPQLEFMSKEERGHSSIGKVVQSIRANYPWSNMNPAWGAYKYEYASDEYLSPESINKDFDEGFSTPQREDDKKLFSKLYEWITLQDDDNAKNGIFSYPVWVNYAVKLYDDSLVCSVPVLLSASSDYPYIIRYANARDHSAGGEKVGDEVEVSIERKHAYKIFYAIKDIPEMLEKWSDIITSIEIYTSLAVGGGLKSSTIGRINYTSPDNWGSTYGTIDLKGPRYDFEEELLFKGSQLHLQEELTLEEFVGLQLNQPRYLNCIGHVKDQDLVNRKMLDLRMADFTRYPYKFGKMLTINKRILGVDVSRTVEMRNLMLSAIDLREDENDDPSERIVLEVPKLVSSDSGTHSYRIDHESVQQYYPHTPYIARDVTHSFDIQYSVQLQDRMINTPDVLTYKYEVAREIEIEGITYRNCAHQMIVCPDVRCKSAYVELSRRDGAEVQYNRANLPMKPFPGLQLSYYLGDINEPLSNAMNPMDRKPEETDNIEDMPNYVMMSSSENPFYFPLGGRFSMNDNIMSVAATSIPLSEGQFGEYTLYVFTDAGIYAMRSNSEGNLVSSDYVAGEVIINPDCVFPLSQSVLFVTDKGVMAISGREIHNLSPYMNGKNFILGDDVKEMIAKSKYASCLDYLEADPPFMEFMSKAKGISDYAGTRAIFICEGVSFAYVLKLDTNTWHKMSIPEGFDKCVMANSYPDAIVSLWNMETITIDDTRLMYGNMYTSLNLTFEYLIHDTFTAALGLSREENHQFVKNRLGIPLTDDNAGLIADLKRYLENHGREPFFKHTVEEREIPHANIYDFSTKYNPSEDEIITSMIVTRPFDLDEPDVLKVINHLRIRGYFREKGIDGSLKVQYILLGSNNGMDYHRLTSLRGKSWKLFRMVILAEINPNERISWVDIDYEPRFTNRLR